MNEDSGRIVWSKESKHYLLGLIKEHSVIINPNVSSETMMKKELAWMNIEQSFASDGIPCQLNKLKRLWKRMKDNARQNTMKPSEQKRRGMKNIRPPTELDWQVHNLLAGRKLDGRSKIKRAYPPPKSSINVTRLPPKPAPSFSKNKSKVEYLSDVDDNDLDLDSDTDLVNLLTPQQFQSSQPNGFHDALEPMTIIEELNRPQPSNQIENELHIIDDETVDDEYTFNRHVTSSENPNQSDPTNSTDIQQLQRELLLHEIQLKLVQRQHEDERMGNERELYRKQSILLDMQTKKAALELQKLKYSVPQPTAKK